MRSYLLLIGVSLICLSLSSESVGQGPPRQGGPGKPPPPPPRKGESAKPPRGPEGGPGGGGALRRQRLTATTGSLTIRGDVWADNWFALYLGETLLIEDAVPITTERSFNAESFEFHADYPLVLNFIAKDYKENDTGLEYIGTPRQQMGDGGLIAQFTDAATGKVIAVTNGNWTAKVIHRAPLDAACAQQGNPQAGVAPCAFLSLEEPAGWKTRDFSPQGWDNASVFSFNDVKPKQGYDQVKWDRSAKFIWGPDLHKDNTVLLRLVVNQPQ